MARHTLLINADGNPVKSYPLSVVHWKSAIKICYQHRCNIISEYEDWQVHSPSVTINVPAIIMSKEYIKPINNGVRFSLDNILLRDGYRCQYCGEIFNKDDLTMDHVIPKYHGGKTTWTNIVSACHTCNSKKSNFLDMRPLNKPIKPTYWTLMEKIKKYPIIIDHESWRSFIGWDGELIINREKFGSRNYFNHVINNMSVKFFSIEKL